MKMRTILRLIALVFLALPLHAAQTLMFSNGSFEAQALGEGGFVANNITSWSGVLNAGPFNPDAPLNFAPDGLNVAYMDASGTMNQDLRFAGNVAVTAQAGATVTVNFFRVAGAPGWRA